MIQLNHKKIKEHDNHGQNLRNVLYIVIRTRRINLIISEFEPQQNFHNIV